MAGKFTIFSRVGKTRIIPIGLKILLIFICLILLSNFATNYISLQLSQRQIINLSNTIMVEQLKELYNNSANQYQIYKYSGNKQDSNASMQKVAEQGFTNPNSVALGVRVDGEIQWASGNNPEVFWSHFNDNIALDKINGDLTSGISEGSISFRNFDGDYFGVYKFQDDWNHYIIRAEKRSDLAANNRRVYLYTSLLIVGLTLLFIVIGYIILNKEIGRASCRERV